MSVKLRDVILTQQDGLNAILDNAKISIALDGQTVILFSVLDAEATEAFFLACAQLDDCEPEPQEQSLSDAATARPLRRSLRI